MKSKQAEIDSDSQVEDGSELDSNARKEQLKFWPRVWADLSDKELLPLKLLFFIKSATVFVLYPYLTLHIKSLGLDADKAGLSNALTIFTIIGQPLAGVISDKLGNFKLFLSVITFLTTIPALLLLTIPLARETVDLPATLTFSLQYQLTENSNYYNDNSTVYVPKRLGNLSAPLTFTSINEEECIFINGTEAVDRKQVSDEMQVVQCGFICDHHQHPRQSEQDTIYTMLGRLPVPAGKRYNIPGTEGKFFEGAQCQSHNQNQTAEPACLQHYFEGMESDCTVGFEFETFRVSVQSIYKEDLHENVTAAAQFRIDSIKFEDNDDHMASLKSCQHISFGYKKNCQATCISLMPRKSFCSNDKVEKVYNETLTFWLYNVLRVALGLLSSTSWIMYEGAVLAIMKEKNGDYGIQRASSFIAAIIAAPLAGFLISYFNDFRPAFYLYGVLQVISTLLTMKIPLDFRQPATQVFGSLWKVLKKTEVMSLMLAILCSGTAWGFLESFLFWFLQNLGGSGLLMGLTITVGGLAGLPFLIVNKPIIDKFGHVNVIAIGLIFYGIRLVGYSFINDPWMCLPLEALEAFTSSLAITAANTYAAELADKNTVVSIQGIIGALYYSVGRSIGSLIGGYLIQLYGEREAYRVLAVGAFASGLIYMIFSFLYQLHQRRKKRFMNINLPQTSLDDNKLEGLKFDGGYVGPFSVSESSKDDP